MLLPLMAALPLYPRLEYHNMETYSCYRKQKIIAAEGTSGTLFLLDEFHTSMCEHFSLLKKFYVITH